MSTKVMATRGLPTKGLHLSPEDRRLLSLKLLTPRQFRIIEKRRHIPTGLRELMQQKETQRKKWTEPGANFFVGQKSIYLPKFTVALERNERLSPSFVQFHVPLFFSKLDLRDYLWHVYNVKIHEVRSFIREYEDGTEPEYLPGHARRHIRRRPTTYSITKTKHMIVKLDRPFVFPPLPSKKGDEKDRELYEATGVDMYKTMHASLKRQGKQEKNVEKEREYNKNLSQAATNIVRKNKGESPFKSSEVSKPQREEVATAAMGANEEENIIDQKEVLEMQKRMKNATLDDARRVIDSTRQRADEEKRLKSWMNNIISNIDTDSNPGGKQRRAHRIGQ